MQELEELLSVEKTSFEHFTWDSNGVLSRMVPMRSEKRPTAIDDTGRYVVSAIYGRLDTEVADRIFHDSHGGSGKETGNNRAN